LSSTGYDISDLSAMFMAYTTSRNTKDTVDLYKANNLEQISKLAPLVSLKRVHATHTTTKMDKQYFVSFFFIKGSRSSANEKTTGLVMWKIFSQRLSSYWSRRKPSG